MLIVVVRYSQLLFRSIWYRLSHRWTCGRAFPRARATALTLPLYVRSRPTSCSLLCSTLWCSEVCVDASDDGVLAVAPGTSCPVLTRTGRWWSSIRCPPDKTTDAASDFSSSRTFKGQL